MGPLSTHSLLERGGDARLVGLVHNLEAIVWEADLGSDRASFVSAGAREILGYGAEEWTGTRGFWRDHLHPDDRDAALAFAEDEIAACRDHQYEYRMIAADFREVWFRDYVHVVRDASGEPCLLRGLMVDITDRKRAEAALAESESRFRTVFEHAGLGIALVDADGKPLEVNRAVEQLLGRDAAELASIPFADLTHPEDVDADVGLYRRLRAGALDRYDLEKRFLHADGSVRWGRLTCTAVRGADGEFSHAVALVEDITERKALEEQLLHAQKLDAVGRLAGGVAHDFNNLLTALGGHAEFLVAGLDPDDPRRHEAEEIRRIGERAAHLTRHLLAFSRRQMLQPRVLDLTELVGELEKMLTRLIGEHIELRSVAAPDLWPVEADPGQLEQVVVNLIVNARDAMPTGGTLTIELGNAEVEDGADGALPGRYVRVAVTDTGLGLDPGVREHLFEPFFTTKELGKGTGLGLATTYGIVEQSGGFIRVESEPDRGTRFEVYFPASERAPEQPAPLPADAGGGRETVLLVEDEEVVRDVVRQMLERQGYEVLVAGDGEEALALAEEHRGHIDVLATDVVMPRMSGRELADRLLPLRPGLPVLFMSGYTEDPAVWDGLEERRAFLQKPFSVSDLSAALRSLLAGRPS